MELQSKFIFDARIKHPFLMLVSGATMSGKTDFVMTLLENARRLIHPPPENIVWFYGEETSTIRQVRSSYDNRIDLVQGIPSSFETYINPSKNNLFVFDDLMEEVGNDKNVTTLFTKQSHHRNISVILITQDLYYKGSERKTLFRNAQYLVLFANPLDMSGTYAVASRMMPKRVPLFLKIFEVATSRPYGYLFIDGKQSSPSSARFRSDIFNFYQKVYSIQ